MDPLTPEQRHKNMVSIRSKDTSIEVVLRKALWHHGYRYRKNYASLPGKPDIVISKHRLVIFCDSEFFHGKDWDKLHQRLEKSEKGPYWINKITRNMQRDAENEQALRNQGWMVLRFWGKDILKHTDDCIKAVDEAVSASLEKTGGYHEARYRTSSMKPTSGTRRTSCMAGFSRQMDFALSVPVWTTIPRRLASTCWRCWRSLSVKGFCNDVWRLWNEPT